MPVPLQCCSQWMSEKKYQIEHTVFDHVQRVEPSGYGVPLTVRVLVCHAHLISRAYYWLDMLDMEQVYVFAPWGVQEPWHTSTPR